MAVVGPASATFIRMERDVARESLEVLGLEVLVGERDRHGYLAGDVEIDATKATIRMVEPVVL